MPAVSHEPPFPLGQPNVFAPIVLKKSPALNLGPFPRNNDSISVCALNHCCISRAQLDWKLRAKNVFRLFQHYPPIAVIPVRDQCGGLSPRIISTR